MSGRKTFLKKNRTSFVKILGDQGRSEGYLVGKAFQRAGAGTKKAYFLGPIRRHCLGQCSSTPAILRQLDLNSQNSSPSRKSIHRKVAWVEKHWPKGRLRASANCAQAQEKPGKTNDLLGRVTVRVRRPRATKAL